MTTEIKDQSKRKRAITELAATIAKYDAAIQCQRLVLNRQIEKQINRLAELKFQKLLLKQAEDQAAFAARVAGLPTSLVKNPELKIQANQDGVWLHFKASTGICASLNLHCLKDTKTIVGQGLRQWADDYATLNPPPEPPPIGN